MLYHAFPNFSGRKNIMFRYPELHFRDSINPLFIPFHLLSSVHVELGAIS